MATPMMASGVARGIVKYNSQNNKKGLAADILSDRASQHKVKRGQRNRLLRDLFVITPTIPGESNFWFRALSVSMVDSHLIEAEVFFIYDDDVRLIFTC